MREEVKKMNHSMTHNSPITNQGENSKATERQVNHSRIRGEESILLKSKDTDSKLLAERKVNETPRAKRLVCRIDIQAINKGFKED